MEKIRPPREKGLLHQISPVNLIHLSIQLFCPFSFIPVLNKHLPSLLHDEMRWVLLTEGLQQIFPPILFFLELDGGILKFFPKVPQLFLDIISPLCIRGNLIKSKDYLGIVELAFNLVFVVEKISDASDGIISNLLNQFWKFLGIGWSEAAGMGRYGRDKGRCLFIVELIQILQLLVHFWNCKNHAQFKLTIYK